MERRARDWAVGQGVAAINLLDQLTDPKAGWQGIFPELVLFDCYACHKRMSDKSWGPRQGTGRPGVVRLNDSNSPCSAMLAAVDKGAEQRDYAGMTRAASRDHGEPRRHAGRRPSLRATLEGLLPRVAATS